MTSPDISWFKTAAMKMDWTAARQKAISENIANADTPGFVGKDVTSFEEHLSSVEEGSRETPIIQEADKSWGGSFDGNKVVLEEQALLASQTAGDFALATKLYRKGHAMLVLAAGNK